MAPLRQKHMKSGKLLDEAILGTMQKVNKVETMDIDGIRYFPCRICNRSFKDEKLAICHFKKCKPPIYLVTNEELDNKSSKNDDKDPYEIIPEEIELEGQIVNNNSCNHNKNGSVKWRKNFRKYNNNETEIIPKKRPTNSSVLDLYSNSTCITEPKRDIVQSVDNSSESEDIVGQELSIGLTSTTEETTSKNNAVNMIEKQTTKKKKNLNTEKQRRNYNQLTEQEIEERLKKISDRLKKHKQPQTVNEEEEEEERREIEERLSVLNKDSEVCVIQNGVGESDVKLKERNISTEPSQQNIKNCKVGISSNIFGDDISKSNMVQQHFGNMQSMKSEILEFREEALNPHSEIDRVVVISQRPDGQLHGCRKCSQVFLSSLELLRHSRRDHTYPRIIMAPSEIKKFMSLKDRSHCPICEKPLSSTYKSIYVKHLQTHSCVLEHICPICKKKFKRRDHMRAHQKRHIVGDNMESTELNENEETETEDPQEFVEPTQIFIKGQIS